jgi:hypothetical protein
MRKTALFAAVTALVLIGIGTWICARTLTPTSAVARSNDDASTMMIGAESPSTWPYDNYDIVVY